MTQAPFAELPGTRTVTLIATALTMMITHLGATAMPAIHSVTPSKAAVLQYERVTISVNLEAEYDNPFAEQEIAISAEVIPETGPRWDVPGFLYQPFERRLRIKQKQQVEDLSSTASPEWQIRLSFPQTSVHRVIVAVRDRTGRTEAVPIKLTVPPADNPGMVRRSGAEHRYFVTDQGKCIFLVGANVCWGGNQGTFSYDDWLPRYADAGCNFFRVWLAPSWSTFGLNTEQSGYARIDLKNAWRLDHVVQLAEQLGLRVMLCIDSFNIIRSTKKQHGYFENSPYHPDKGGPVAKSTDYFTKPEMLEAYRDRLRYLVARYGYSPALIAWEFWNEVDIVDSYNGNIIGPWHQNMARHLRHIDPWDLALRLQATDNGL